MFVRVKLVLMLYTLFCDFMGDLMCIYSGSLKTLAGSLHEVEKQVFFN